MNCVLHHGLFIALSLILCVVGVGCSPIARDESTAAPSAWTDRTERLVSGPGPATTESLPAASEAEAETMTALLAGGWIEVSIHLPPTSDGPAPVVISPIVPDAVLLARGVATVHYRTRWEILRDLPKPGADGCREPCPGRWLLSSPKPENVGRYYFALIGEDALRSVPRVIDHLETIPEIDASRISIAGSSTSGFTALEAFAAEPRLSMGVVQVACGDYHLFLRSSSLALDDDPRWLAGGELVLDPDYEEIITRREPIGHVDRFPPRPLLLMTGEADRAIPAACSRKTAAALARAYARRGAEDRFRFIEFPGVGHNLGPRAQQEALEWWKQWLEEPAPD